MLVSMPDPNTDMLKGVVELDAGGYIKLGGRGQAASDPRVYAAGEAADPVYRQAVTAAADGARVSVDWGVWGISRSLSLHF